MSPSASEICIRVDVRVDDGASVRRLVASTAAFREDEVEIAVELVQESISRGAQSGYQFVFAETRQDELLAYACFGPIPCTLHSFDLYWIAVDPEWQRAGLGRRLMTEVETLVRASNGDKIYVDTSGRKSYEPTRRFYVSCGYKAVAELKDFYAPSDSKIIYAKQLKA